MDSFLFILMCVICLGAGFLLARVIKPRPLQRVSGTLRVDQSDPDGPYLFLELDGNVNVIQSEYVTFRVRVENYLPQ